MKFTFKYKFDVTEGINEGQQKISINSTMGFEHEDIENQLDTFNTYS